MSGIARALAALAISVILPASAFAGDGEGLSIVIRNDDGHMIYTVNGKTTPVENVSDELRSAYELIGKSGNVAVISHVRVQIGDLANLRGHLQAIGFLNVRYFYFTDPSGRMGEVSFNHPSVPFSTRPWQEKVGE